MSTSRPRRVRAATVAALLTLATLVTACGGDAPGADPNVGASGSSSPGDTTPAGPATPDSSSGAPATTGLLMEMPRVTIKAPEGWKRSPKLADFITQTADPHSGAVLQLSDLAVLGTGDAGLPEQARNSIAGAGYVRDPEIREPVLVNGVKCYHVAGRTSGVTYVEEFGAIVGGGDISIHFEFDPDTPEAERQATIDSVLASVTWK